MTMNQIETLWCQTSQVDLIRDGDWNTRYFHTSTIIWQRFDRIETLGGPDNVWHNEPNQVKEIVVNHFKNLFSESTVEGQSMGTLSDQFHDLTIDNIKGLAANYMTKEVYNVLKDMGSLKAPGPDSFQALFFQRY